MKKECLYFSSLITAFVDQELEGAQKSEIESHLKVCRHCNQNYLHEMRIKHVVSARMTVLKAPEHLFQRIHRQLFSDKPKPSFWELLQEVFFYRPVAASFAVVALVLIVTLPTYMFSISSSSTPRRAATLEQNGEQIELQGQVICLDCQLQQNDAHNLTPHTAAHRTGIKCNANQIWSFLDTSDQQEFLHDQKYLEKNVVISGVAYHSARYIHVKNYRLL